LNKDIHMPLYIRCLSRKSVGREYLSKIFKGTLKIMRKKDIEVSLVFIGRRRMKDLNRIYRGKNKVTDILSFGNDKSINEKFICPKGVEESLGEILICIERANTQAHQKGHSLKKEVGILLIHGMLHLMGFDHENDKDARIMRSKEKIIAELYNN